MGSAPRGRGVHPPWGNDAFSPLFRIFPILPFPEKFLDFHPPKFLNFWWLFLSHRLQILNSPYFSCFTIFPPYFGKIIIPPPVFRKFTSFLHTSCVFRFPPALTMMHLCITQCTYWTALPIGVRCRIHHCSPCAAILRLPFECVDFFSAPFLDVVQPFSARSSSLRLALHHSKHHLLHQPSCYICVNSLFVIICSHLILNILL